MCCFYVLFYVLCLCVVFMCCFYVLFLCVVFVISFFDNNTQNLMLFYHFIAHNHNTVFPISPGGRMF
jgi:hypothetical protein